MRLHEAEPLTELFLQDGERNGVHRVALPSTSYRDVASVASYFDEVQFALLRAAASGRAAFLPPSGIVDLRSRGHVVFSDSSGRVVGVASSFECSPY